MSQTIHDPMPPDGVLELFHGYLDDQLSESQFAVLQSMLLENPAYARWFAQVALIHSGTHSQLHQRDLCQFYAASDSSCELKLDVDPANIRELLHESAEADRKKAEAESLRRMKQALVEAEEDRLRQQELERLNRPRRPQPIEIPRFAVWLAATAVIVLIGFVTQAMLSQSSSQGDLAEVSPPLATPAIQTYGKVTQSFNAIWTGDNRPIGADQRLPLGEFALDQGVVEILLDDGSILVGEAPFEMDLLSANKVLLNKGKVLARVPEEAIGFTISTSAGAIVDLGTEFGVDIEESGNVDVHVLDGAVALAANSTTVNVPRETLTEGGARQIAANGASVNDITFNKSSFLRKVPASSYELAVTHSAPLSYWRFNQPYPVVKSQGELEFSASPNYGVFLDQRTDMQESSNTYALFSNDNQGIQLQDLPELKLNKSFSIEAWVKLTDDSTTSAKRIISSFYRNATDEGGFAMGVGGSQFASDDNYEGHGLIFTFHGVYDSISTTAIPFDRWTHVAVTVNELGHPQMYIDGSPVPVMLRATGHGVMDFAPLPADSPLDLSGILSKNNCSIGCHPLTSNDYCPPERWRGGIDELAIFDRPLTPEEIGEHYQAGLKRP
ncbi:LamG-like jellyroll fold domain-containing protein [Aeoliella mucimassa]|uniref:FecR protein n=1 Tax=Aeoliella mucimassa TaxID=2527972 RepID=A0A518AQ58_9BACT|nr:LamG-like jellyroll fold domain-containing protein [Aeoliella mucimassa]QDU56853.1 FecR protein [Aeoliella mucimassa]